MWGEKVKGFSEGNTALPYFKKDCRNFKFLVVQGKLTSILANRDHLDLEKDERELST